MIANLIFMIALAAPQGPPPPPPRPPGFDQPTPKGTASIKGRVTSAETGRPLRRAQVRVSGADLPQQGRTASTDLEGEYEIADLPAGRYTIRVTRSGHLEMLHGQRRFGEPGTPLQVADGAQVSRIDFALPRAGTISGRVIDDTGEPVGGAQVLAMRAEFFRGRRRLVPVGSFGTTDDTGQFRILTLPPGSYLVAASLRETWTTDTEPRQTLAFGRTFFPGTTDPAAAQPVKVGVAQEIGSIEFPLVPMRAATLSGTAVSVDGSALAGATLMLAHETLGPSGGMIGVMGNTRVQPDGSWTLRDIAPGEYRIQISSQNRERPPESGSTTITVQGADIDGIIVRADPGTVVAGELVVEGDAALPGAAGSRRVMTVPADQDRTLSRAPSSNEHSGSVREDATFSWLSLSGPVMFRIVPMPAGWAIKSVEIAGREYADTPYDVKPGGRVDGVKVVLTNRFPVVTGRLTDDKGAPAEGTVILFPADESKWTTEGATRSTRPDQSGTFRFEAVRPGEYLVVALDYVQQWQVSDPEFLREQRDAAMSLLLREGESESVTLKVRR